jgi:hypothetical protein
MADSVSLLHYCHPRELCVVNGMCGRESQFEKCIAPNSGFLEQKTVYGRALYKILRSSSLCAIL